MRRSGVGGSSPLGAERRVPGSFPSPPAPPLSPPDAASPAAAVAAGAGAAEGLAGTGVLAMGVGVERPFSAPEAWLRGVDRPEGVAQSAACCCTAMALSTTDLSCRWSSMAWATCDRQFGMRPPTPPSDQNRLNMDVDGSAVAASNDSEPEDGTARAWAPAEAGATAGEVAPGPALAPAGELDPTPPLLADACVAPLLPVVEALALRPGFGWASTPGTGKREGPACMSRSRRAESVRTSCTVSVTVRDSCGRRARGIRPSAVRCSRRIPICTGCALG